MLPLPFLAKKPRLPCDFSGRSGVVKSSGNGFLAVQVKTAGGVEKVNVRPKTVAVASQVTQVDA